MRAILFGAVATAALQLLMMRPSAFAALPDGAAVLRAVTTNDALLAAGVTLEGTVITLPGKSRALGSVGSPSNGLPAREEPKRTLPAARYKWKFTGVSSHRIAYDTEVVEVLTWEDWLLPGANIPQPTDQQGWMYGRVLAFISPEATGFYNLMGPLKPGVWSAPQIMVRDGVSGSINLYRPNPLTLSDYLDLPLLLVGRGYAKHLESISSVEALADGRLSVQAKGKPFYTRATKWELVVEPAASYLVRSATYYVDDSERTIEKSRFVITTSGLQWFGSLAVPEKFEQRDPLGDQEQPFLRSGRVSSASLKGDEQFFNETVAMFQPPFPVSTEVADNRTNPPGRLSFPAGEVLDRNSLR